MTAPIVYADTRRAYSPKPASESRLIDADWAKRKGWGAPRGSLWEREAERDEREPMRSRPRPVWTRNRGLLRDRVLGATDARLVLDQLVEMRRAATRERREARP